MRWTLTLLWLYISANQPEIEEENGENETEIDAEKEKNKQKFIRSVCEKTGIKVYVPKWTVGGAGSSPDLVMFENSNCRAQDFNKTHYYLFVDLINPKKSCGTKRRSEGIEIIYENFITWNNREDRRVEKLANVSCTQYLEEKHVRLTPEKSINNFNVGENDYRVQMSLFESKDYEKLYDGFNSQGYIQIGVGEFIYIRLGYESEKEPADTDAVVISDCWGSRSAIPTNKKTSLDFIKNGCQAEQGVVMRRNGFGPSSEWKFQMFKWKNVAQHEQFIYLHCQAWICNECKKPELSHACYGDITDFRRRRRAVLWTDREATNHELAKTFSVGPIYPEDHSPLLNDRPSVPGLRPIDSVEKEITPEEEEDNFVMAVIIGSVAGFCGLFLLIVLVIFVKKYRERPFNFCTEIKEQEDDEKKIEQGFVFELRSSTDPVIPRLNIDQFRPRHDDIKEKPEVKLDKKDFHGSKISLRSGGGERGRRRRDRSSSRDRRERSRSESRKRGTSRERGERGSSRDRNRDRSKSRDRSNRDLRRRDSRGSRGDVRGSRSDVRGSRHDVRGSRTDLNEKDDRKMRRSRSKQSLTEKRLSPLTEDKLSLAEQELLKNLGNGAPLLTKSYSRQTLNEEPSGMKRSKSQASVRSEKRGRERSSSRMRRSESRSSVAAGHRSESKERRRDRSGSRTRNRSPGRDKRHRSPSRDARTRSESKSRDHKRSPSRSRGERRRSPSRSRGEHRGSKADLAGSKADLRGSKMDLSDRDRKNGRRKNNRQRDIDPNEEFSAL